MVIETSKRLRYNTSIVYKLIALDLDGTLLDASHQLPEANAEALRQAMERGVRVVIATSRWHGIEPERRGDILAQRLGIDTPLVCSNGAQVRDSDGRDLLLLPLDDGIAREVTQLGDDGGWEMFTTIGDATYMQPRPNVIPEKLPAGLKVAARQSEHIGEAATVSVLVFGQNAVDELEARYGAAGDHRARFSFNRPVGLPPYVVLTHPEADKARALDLVCRQLGVAPDETIAMGDSESDLEMLRYAGLGIAMRNAPDSVKRAALHIAPANTEYGVAWAVRRFLL